MGLFKRFRSKSRFQQPSPTPRSSSRQYASEQSPPAVRDFAARLPESIRENIFTFVCPHTHDDRYEECEKSQIGDGCMLCDLRDLALCAQVCRKWYLSAQKLLYGSVRIDAVHYCALEEELAERRKKARGNFRSKSGVEAGEVPNVRLSLLCRTVRESAHLASLVHLLKVPYMTRETAKGDLARTVSALPNLRYVDLPDGFFTGDASCLPLRQELQARCPDIRKMTYRSGSEDALELLAHRHWQSIEILELSALAIEPSTLRIVLASLPTLRDLTLSDLSWVDDTIFQSSPAQLPDFPALQALKLENMPRVTAQGLQTYLNAPQNREVLSSLTLQSTGVTVHGLHHVLWASSSLRHLSISETVSKSLALSTQETPPLTSISLTTLHYEISSSEDVHGLQKPAESYYAYLATSLHQNALPALETLYVRDQSFPEMMLLPSRPNAPFCNGSAQGSLRSMPSSPSLGSQQQSRFNQTLEVFSKGIDELEWVFTSITPPAPASRNRRASVTASGGRPLSAYSAGRGLGPQWAQGGFGGEARKSVIVGNGFGGFLAVPQEQVPRPMTADGARGAKWGSIGSQGTNGSGNSMGSWLTLPPSLAESQKRERRGSKHDLWR